MEDTKQLLKIALAGMGISLCGALPLGTLNTTAMQIAIAEGYVKALLFASGVVLIEMAYLAVTLSAVAWIREHLGILNYVKRLAVLIFLVIAGISFYKACFPSPPGEAHIVSGDFVVKGIFLSAINPAQVPFWLGWNTALLSRGLLRADKKCSISYISGAAIGTLIGLGIFITIGIVLQQKFAISQQYIHAIIGLVFLASAIQQYDGKRWFGGLYSVAGLPRKIKA